MQNEHDDHSSSRGAPPGGLQPVGAPRHGAMAGRGSKRVNLQCVDERHTRLPRVSIAGARRLLATTLAMLVMAFAFSASAQTDPDELARRHFESGAAYFEQGEYDSALREFTRAYQLSGRIGLLLNIAAVHERLGQLELAIGDLDEYLGEQEDPTVRLRRDNLQRRLDAQRASMPTTGLEAASGATALPPATETPLPGDLQPPPPAPERGQPAPRPNRTPSFVLIGVGGAAGAASLVTGLLAVSEHDKAENRCGNSCDDDELAKGRRYQTISTVLTGVAVVAGGIGVYLYFNPSYETESSGGFSVGLQSTGAGARAQANWVF